MTMTILGVGTMLDLVRVDLTTETQKIWKLKKVCMVHLVTLKEKILKVMNTVTKKTDRLEVEISMV